MRLKVDACNTCVALKVQLEQFLDKESVEAIELKNKLVVHLADAVTQRQYAKEAILIAVNNVGGSNSTLSSIDNLFDADRLLNFEEKLPKSFMFLCEDFAGNGTAPHFGSIQPNKEYYLSKLAVLTFIVYNPSISAFNLYVYDQRQASKDANSMCSLRFRHHLTSYLASAHDRKYLLLTDNLASPQSIIVNATDSSPLKEKCLFLVMDNCVGQNKSQCVFKFYLLLSILFYDRVCLHFLISGHSHMQCDTCWSWCKSSLRNFNLYDTSELVERYNSVKGIKAELVQQNVFSSEWEDLLDSAFPDISKISGGYTQYSYFEIKDGLIEMRNNAGSPVCCSFRYYKPENVEEIKCSILSRIFGEPNLDNIRSANQICLKVADEIPMPQKTLDSIALKKNFVPNKYWPFYGWQLDNNSTDNEPAPATSNAMKKIQPKKVLSLVYILLL